LRPPLLRLIVRIDFRLPLYPPDKLVELEFEFGGSQKLCGRKWQPG
jgi:hypothetical protein